MDEQVNSKEYWEERFTNGSWEINKGQEQTRYFYGLLIKMLPQWLKTNIRTNGYSIADFGCAEGQGIPILAAELGRNIKGLDFSGQAVRKAQTIFPQFQFQVADVWEYNEAVDVAVMSNIIEHFPNPFELVRHISSFAQKYIIVMVPLEEKNLMTEHQFTFLYNNIPSAVGNFQIIYFAEHDCRKDPEKLFEAKQILLVYSCVTSLNESITIQQMDGLFALRELQQKEVQHQEALHSMEMQHQKELQQEMKQQFETERSRIIAELDVAKTAIEKGLKLRELQQENTHLSGMYREADQKYIKLVDRFNHLNAVYGEVAKENVTIKNSRTYRIAELEKKLAYKLHVAGLMKFVLSVRRNGWKEARRQYKEKRKDLLAKNSGPLFNADDTSTLGGKNPQVAELQWRRVQCLKQLSQGLDESTKKVEKILDSCDYKGIVVYPHAVHWEPIQRPQQFLREFSKKNYLCFFCETAEVDSGIKEICPNLFIVYGEEYLLPALQDKCPIVLATYHKQSVFCDLLPQKVLWFDLLDNLEFFSGGADKVAQDIYRRLMEEADVVSYSAENLKGYIPNRRDAIKLNNGVNTEDFSAGEGGFEEVPELQKIKARGKKIVGYYGAIEEWFDVKAIQYLLDKTDAEIVLIGRSGIDLSGMACSRLHLMGAVPYQKLKNYAHYFDIALIPFVVNKLTNSVSPVKFYEYVAQGLPVVSSDIREMKGYACDSVKIYHDYTELVSQVTQLCSRPADGQKLHAIAEANTWESRVETVLAVLEQNVLNLRPLADFSDKGCVDVLSVTFFKYDGTTYYSGGAERYLLDLHDVCKELGIQYRIYQYAEYNWIRFYGDVEVVGLASKENDVNDYTVALVKEMEKTFTQETTKKCSLNIYSPFFIHTEESDTPTIGISHGISWDSEQNHFTDGNTFWQLNKNIIDSASYCDSMISVDTNTCNWFQTINYDIGHKIRYVPNYVDNTEFCPRADFTRLRDHIVITYPRRLYAARGLYVVLEVIDSILSQYPHVEFHFVGKGFEVDTKHVQKKIDKWGPRVKMYSKAPDKMYEVYQNTDIALIPTMYSEGTSLSCLEALSSGNAVVATRVGGLTNLILNDYNGILVEPSGEAIKEVLFDLLDHPDKMNLLKQNAVQSARTFSKDQWKERWKTAILNAVGGRQTQPYSDAKRCVIQVGSTSSAGDPKVVHKIEEYLSKGYYVYVACKGNTLKPRSYKRLQFIESNEELYFTPEITLKESEL